LIPPATIAKIDRIDNISAAQSCGVIKIIISLFETKFRREITKAKIEITNLPTDNNGLTNHICLVWNLFSDISVFPIAIYPR
jgi:hypothetical protein